MFDHGIAIDKETGEFGIITAYLPDMETFAVSFNPKVRGWWTFKITEEDFNRKFHVALNGE
jgi:hypothetical protein